MNHTSKNFILYTEKNPLAANGMPLVAKRIFYHAQTIANDLQRKFKKNFHVHLRYAHSGMMSQKKNP